MSAILKCLIAVMMMTMMVSSQVIAEDITGNSEKVTVSRTINIDGSNKYVSVYLDEAVYRYTADDLSDIRIIDDKNNYIPYYIYNEKTYIYHDKELYTGSIEERFIKGNKEYYDIAVEQEENRDRILSYLEFEIVGSNFASSVTMQGSYDGNAWEVINNGGEAQLYKVATGSQMRFYFDRPVKYSYFRMSMPRQIEEITISKVNAVFENTAYQLQSLSKDKKSQYEMVTDEEKKLSTITIDNKDRLRVTRFVLNIAGIFNRGYTLYGIDNNGMKIAIDTGTIYSTDISAENSKIPIDVQNDQIFECFIIEIANLDDQPIEVNQIDEIYSIDKLVFEGSKGKQYTLIYGDKTLTMPQYDISHYIEDIEALAHNMGSLGNVELETILTDQPQKQEHTLLLSILMGLTSIILIITIVRAGKKQIKNE